MIDRINIREMKRDKSHHMKFNPCFINGTTTIGDLTDKNTDKEKIAVYIHVPFCNKICSFCNMRRSLSSVDDKYSQYVVKHIKEISKSNFAKTSIVESIYFGGGTPTTLGEEELCEILKALKESFTISSNCEISMESTLNELDENKLSKLMECGLNRISIGVQTFNNNGRKLLGRIGDRDFVVNRIKSYKRIGLENINIDLIYNYPNQSEADLMEDIYILNELDIAGFSLYSLIHNEKASLKNIIQVQNIKVDNSTKKDHDYFIKIANEMKANKFDFLELTKMVKDKRDEYKYIKLRNTGHYTIPIGAGAGGNIFSSVIMNPLPLNDYYKYVDNLSENKVTLLKAKYFKIDEYLNTIQFAYIDKKHEFNEIPLVEEFIKNLLEDKLIYEEKDRYLLTLDGIFYGNTIAKTMYNLIENII